MHKLRIPDEEDEEFEEEIKEMINAFLPMTRKVVE